MKKPIKRISDEMVVEALQIVHNYCNQEMHHCSDGCILRGYDGLCLFYGELVDRFDQWKKDNSINIVNNYKTKGRNNGKRNN